ncbi:phase 1 flagellin transcriptional repressor [Atlantibacter hermannii]|uniref:phase 1 flagellin transcriptional repressor n=1 Tax=Atlantibacter hermannii TaxID=565 RepID=UPI0022B78CAC|nr:phase 1 flagellin transcriptional repressor [Atlantibacter hermannii]MCZ7835271.1 phase 1 flagellin transcriptional repressor [Atlantibacter hermannii]
MVNDITYGREAEVWPRDYSLLSRRLQFLRFNAVPVKMVSCNGLSIIGYVAKFYPEENVIYASSRPKGTKRIKISMEYIASLEELPVDSDIKPYLIEPEQFNSSVTKPTRRDFFSICNKCFQQGVGIKVHMADRRTVEGKTTGVNACQVGVIRPNGNHMQIMFDWVTRITSSDFVEK